MSVRQARDRLIVDAKKASIDLKWSTLASLNAITRDVRRQGAATWCIGALLAVFNNSSEPKDHPAPGCSSSSRPVVGSLRERRLLPCSLFSKVADRSATAFFMDPSMPMTRAGRMLR
jgi:hypothetical protein